MSAVVPSRRRFVLGALGALGTVTASACGGSSNDAASRAAQPKPTTTPPIADGSVTDGSLPDGWAPDTTWPTPQCMETATNIEGPYYRAAAPFRTDLRAGVDFGVPLLLRGRVFGVGCAAPLLDALVDVWQADGAGHYDNDGTLSVPPEAYRLRGRQRVSSSGLYEVRTVIPGHYLNGSQYRPAHVHVKVSAPGHRELTTQLYFEGDKYNAIDPFIKKPLIMTLQAAADGEQRAWFDFVLAPA
ncbi:MAG: hypothetical protein HYV09_34770 [Deltaproteobacteria bacterium]|nr:hypothetical protein [Deltaproteobacteria bacterium]